MAITKDMTELVVGDRVTHVGSKAMATPFLVERVTHVDGRVAVVYLEGGRFWPNAHGPVTIV